MRLRPPKQGELRTDVSKATMFQGDKGGEKAHGVCRPGRDKLSAKRKVSKGFNFVSAKPPLRRAESRFAKPRCSLQRERIVTFCVVQKVTKKHAGLRPATSIQIAGRYGVFAKTTSYHQVTGNAENSSFPGIAGNDLNRCERVTVVQTQDRYFSKKSYCTASSQ